MNISYFTTTNLIRTGRFYSIYEAPDYLLMEDKTKSGLEVKERYLTVSTVLKVIAGSFMTGEAQDIG